MSNNIIKKCYRCPQAGYITKTGIQKNICADCESDDNRYIVESAYEAVDKLLALPKEKQRQKLYKIYQGYGGWKDDY